MTVETNSSIAILKNIKKEILNMFEVRIGNYTLPETLTNGRINPNVEIISKINMKI